MAGFSMITSWTKENPDLIHDVTNSVYTASVQGQVLRDDLDIFPKSLDSRITPGFDSSSVSFGGDNVNWNSNYISSGAHTGSLVPSYSWTDSITNSYSISLNPSINPPRGNVASWSVKSASVSLLSTEISDVKIEPHPSYANNDRPAVENRTDGYLNREDHVFDWRYRVRFILYNKNQMENRLHLRLYLPVEYQGEKSGWKLYDRNSSRQLRRLGFRNHKRDRFRIFFSHRNRIREPDNNIPQTSSDRRLYRSYRPIPIPSHANIKKQMSPLAGQRDLIHAVRMQPTNTGRTM